MHFLIYGITCHWIKKEVPRQAYLKKSLLEMLSEAYIRVQYTLLLFLQKNA